MEQYFALLRQSPLFQGISPQELSQMLPCLGTRHMQVKKHQMIFRAGDPARWVGLVLSGAVHVIQEDYYGNRSIVSTFQPPQLFGEAFACAGVASLPVSVEAAQDSTLLLLDCQRVIRTCSDACAFHQRLLSNLLHVVAAKNLLLTQKLSDHQGEAHGLPDGRGPAGGQPHFSPPIRPAGPGRLPGRGPQRHVG